MNILIIDVSNIYKGLGDRKLSYKNLLDYCENHGTLAGKVAIVVADPHKKNISFISMLKHLGFTVEFVPNKTSAQFKTIELVRQQIDHARTAFVCTNATCPLFELQEHSEKIFLIAPMIPDTFKGIYRGIAIPPSLLV